MEGARIERVLLRRPDLRYPFAPDFVSRIEGQNVRAVRRRAKYLLIDLASGDVLLMHLGMSGWVRVVRASGAAPRKGAPYGEAGRSTFAEATADKEGAPDEKHDHVVFEMSNGRSVVFSDARRCGVMPLHAPGELAPHASRWQRGSEPPGHSRTAA